MTTRQERVDQIRAMIDDPDLHLSPKEALKTIYYWYMFEIALLARNKAERRCEKWVEKLNIQAEVYNLRKDMSDL